MDTTRKYYFRPDEESRQILPSLFRINHDSINQLIRKNGDFCHSLRDKRLRDKETKGSQKELDTLNRMANEVYEEVKAEDEAELDRLSKLRYASRNNPEKHSELHRAYSALKGEAKRKRKKRMAEFWASVRDRKVEASKIVNKANQKDYSKGWDPLFKTFKVEYTKETSQKQKYHLDDYKQKSLVQARKELRHDESVPLRKFVRGYGTELPTVDSIVTGHSQSGGKDKYTTVAEYREGKQGSHVVRLGFPDPSAWDSRLSKGERKRKQVGQVEITLLGRAIRGTCLFHQALPDDHCIVSACLVVEVRSGNTHFYVILTARPKSEMGKNDFDVLQAFFKSLRSVSRLSLEEVAEARKKLVKYKTHLVKKKDTQAVVAVDEKFEELRNRVIALKGR